MGKDAPDKTKTEIRWKRIPTQVKSKLNPLVTKLLNRCIDITSNTQKTIMGYRDIYGLLQEIQELEKDYARPIYKREENWGDLYKWCEENESEFSSVSIKETSDGDFGLIAEKDLKESEKFLTIPKKLMMSLENAKASKLGPFLKDDKILANMPNVALSIYLLMETLNKNSFWSPYISVLPSKYDTVLYYSVEELEELQRSPVIEKVINTCQSVARQYAYFFLKFQQNEYAKSLDIGPFFTYDLYRWAVSTVMTRQNGVPAADATSDITVLIPFWDMCNHMNGKFATDFNVTRDCLESYAMRDYAKGEEVFIYYGPRSNSDFFIHNAFVYPSNENDFIELKLNISKSDRLASQKIDLCEKKSVPLNGVFPLSKGGSVSENLMTFLKIYVMKEGEVKEASESDLVFDESTEKGKDIRCRALTFLRDRANLYIRSYGTSVEDDEKALEVASNQRLKMAIMLRICEKKILKDCVKFCEEALKT